MIRTLKPEDFTILAMLGTGSYAKVYLVKKKSNSKVLAMKVLKKKMLQKKQQ
jgi:serine/threonine protein kinase